MAQACCFEKGDPAPSSPPVREDKTSTLFRAAFTGKEPPPLLNEHYRYALRGSNPLVDFDQPRPARRAT